MKEGGHEEFGANGQLEKLLPIFRDMPRRERVELKPVQVQITKQGLLTVPAECERGADTAKQSMPTLFTHGIFGAEF